MGDRNRCQECERGLDPGTNEFKVPAFVCETVLNQRLSGRIKPHAISNPNKTWYLCRDCCVSIFLGIEPKWTPFDPNLYGQEGT